MTIRPHRRQYVVGPRPRPLADDWLTELVGPGLWLSHCPDLRVGRATDRTGHRWTLIGLASQTRADRDDPLAELAEGPWAARPDELAARTESWAGRWSLIGAGRLQIDAMGLLGCHWVRDGRDQVWASSSPAALQAEGGPSGTGTDLVFERGLSWVVPPGGARPYGRRLLPSRLLDLTTGRLVPRRLVVPAAELGSDPVTALARALTESIRRLPAAPVHVALSAGADSRIVLGAALAAGVPLDVFTRQAARMSVADRLVPPRVCAAVGTDHRVLHPRRPDPGRAAMAAAHTDGQVSHGDALPFIEAVRDGLTGIEVGGQGFGIGKIKHRMLPAWLPGVGPADGIDAVDVAERTADVLGEPAASANRPRLARWLTDVAADHGSGIDTMDWRDRFYVEQRMAGWQGAKEQVYDMNQHERFFPLSSVRTLGLLLAIDPDRRADRRHQHDLLTLLDPRLLAEPFNPPGAAFGLSTRVHHLWTVDRRRLHRRALHWLRSRDRASAGDRVSTGS